MKKRVFIVHGWDGYPEEGWFPWLKKELEKKGFEVFIPQLPEPDKPNIKNWVATLEKIVVKLDKQTFFVGHSMGCQTIVRYLESLTKNQKIGGIVFVAGFFKRLTNLEDDMVVREIANIWLTSKVDFQKAKSHFDKSIAIFSDNDPYVSLDNQDDFKNIFGSKIIIEHKMGHFSGSTDTKKLPIVLEALINISEQK